jgi:TetR/AcrR family tetracycline transcriptional repressor
MTRQQAHGAREALDRDRLVQVALALLDEVGLDELSMRRLAERLGVTAAALYWYVRDKNELLGLLADAISAETPLPNPNGPWRAEVEKLARGARRVALSHRDAARVLVATLPTGPHRLRAIDAILGVFVHAGFSPADAADAAYVLNVFGVGFMLDETMGPQPPTSNTRRQPVTLDEGASLSGIIQAHLLVERGAVNLTLRADAALPTLYQLSFEGRPPAIETHDGTVRLRQRHGRRESCDLTLAGTIPWEITIDGGAARLTADLRTLHLTSLRISGGVSQSRLHLPQPAGTVQLHISGGVSKLQIERPATAAMRLLLNRASSHITLDGLRLNSVGAGTDWSSPDYADASARYELELGGAANAVSLTTSHQEPGPTTDAAASLDEQMRDWFAGQPPAEYPHLVALAPYLAEPNLDRRFEVGLQMLLDGIERRLAAAGEAAHSDGSGA